MSDGSLSARESPLEQLLARPLEEQLLEQNTEAVARLPPTAHRAGETLIIFTCRSELFAMPAASVRRVFPPLPVHRVPHRPGPHFRGVASEHGELQLVGSLEAALDLGEARSTRSASARRMLLVEAEVGAWLIEVDSVVGVLRSRRETWMAPPSTVSQSRRAVTSSIVPLGMRRAALLDPARLLARFQGALS